MKEGDVMKKENKFDILENTEQSVIDRISSEFPPKNENEKELIFQMSERKFNNNNNNNNNNNILPEIDEQIVSGVEIYKSPIWKRFLSAVAAIAVIAIGAVGTGYALRHFRNVSDVASDIVTGNTTKHDIKKIAPFGDFEKYDYKLFRFNNERNFIDNVLIGDPSNEILIEDGIDWITTFPIYDTMDIDPEQRQKIAELFNNYDYVEEELFYVQERPLGAVKTYIGEGVPKEFEGTIKQDNINEYSSFHFYDGFDLKEEIPYFLYRGNNEVKLLGFMEIGGVDPHGLLICTHLHFADQDGKLVMTDDNVSCDAWRIDYKYFISAINEILGYSTNQAKEFSTVTEDEESIIE